MWRSMPWLRAAVTAVAAGTVLVLAAPGARAQSFDGTYTGTMTCGLLAGQTRPLQTAVAMTVSGSTVNYHRQILQRGGPTGSYERGSGTVTPAGEITLKGQGDGNHAFDADYRGKIEGNIVSLTGEQRWRTTGNRSCQLSLTRASAP
jgi:hypothetical protein